MLLLCDFLIQKRDQVAFVIKLLLQYFGLLIMSNENVSQLILEIGKLALALFYILVFLKQGNCLLFTLFFNIIEFGLQLRYLME